MKLNLFLVALFLVRLVSVEAAQRVAMDSSAHDLSSESTQVSCLNCHWMHQSGAANKTGFSHSLANSTTRFVCYVCHAGFDPNVSSDVSTYVYGLENKPTFVRSKTGGGFETVHFPGQRGINVYDIKAEYQSAVAAPGGSYHMFFGPDYSEILDKNVFNCFDCHNHGVDSTGYPGNRLPKLLWSKGAYGSFGITKAARKDISQYYATEYYCLSCHFNYGYPRKWDGLSWNSVEILIDTFFLATKHSLLERYGTTGVPGVPEQRNPYGHGKDISCFVCHARHASTYPSLMRGNYDENTMCQQCHYGAARDSTFAFTYRLETTAAATVTYNYITAGHFADKQWTTAYGHGKAAALGGADLQCSNCHGAHGTGHYRMVYVSDIVDPRRERGDTGYPVSYNLSSIQVRELDSALVSGFCGGSCHNLKSSDNDMEWWKSGIYYPWGESTKIFPMASSYRGKTVFDASAHTTAVNLTIVQGYTLKACSGCHDSHGTQNKALTWGSEEALCFQCHSASGGAKDIEKYFNVAKSGKSHHPVKSAEQTDSSRVECINCHNPHLATKQYPTIYPYDWSVISDYSSAISNSGELGVVDHENRAKFCATCHFVAFPYYVAPRYDSALETTRGYYPPGVRIKGEKGDIAGDWFSYYYDKYLVVKSPGYSGHYKSDSTCLIDCINCHNPHGSSNPSNIMDKAYQDPMSSYADNFVTAVYDNFGAYDSFYNQNTRRSRKFCFSANGSSGCHLPQYLTTQVVFPDSLGVSTTHHNSRNVPYGDTTGSYYVDEHNPYWDTNIANAAPPSGVWGCSVCHYNAHNPTPNYWYNYSAKADQYCLDCHHPAESTSYNAATGKFLGGAPTRYESTYVEFFSTTRYPLSTTYISKHLKSAGIDSPTSEYCKDCHGEHYKISSYYLLDEYHDVPGSFVSSPRRQGGVYLTDYLNGQSFCLACHYETSAFGTTAPNVKVTYETAGHGRLGVGGDGIKVYCFDCHTKHASQNPYLLRTKIRDVITYPGVRDRNVRTEDLTTNVNSVSVKVDGYQSVCFACHTKPGSGYDSSNDGLVNARASNPGTQLWLGKAVYESSGHGNTKIPPYMDTTYCTTIAGIKCSQWCHEPHGRGTDSNYVFNSTYNDDMLLRKGNVSLCYRCHDKDLEYPAYTTVKIANIKALFDSAASIHNVNWTDSTRDGMISCLNCHNPHTGNKTEPVVIADYRTDMDAGEDEFCLSCHCEESEVPTYAHDNPPPDVLFPIRSSSEEFFTGYDKSYYTASAHGKKPNEVYCKTCHKPHGTNKLNLLREVYDFNQNGNLGGHSYDTIYTTTQYGTTNYREEDVCFGCHRNHDLETTSAEKWNTAWANIPDVLRFYQNYDTGTKTYSGYTRSHHNVFASEQVATGTKVECESCHNQHIATKEKPLTNPDDPNQAMVAYGDEGIAFCISCHDNEPPPGITGLTDEKYKNIKAEYGEPDINGIYPNFSGHYRQKDGRPHQCRLCHSMHGSNFAKQIQDATDSTYDTFKMMRNMRYETLSGSLGGNDTLALSAVTEICLSCHSGKTQFYDDSAKVWRYIPLPPPSGAIWDSSVPVVSYHPALLNTTSAYCSTAVAGTRKGSVKSVYSTVFNVQDTTVHRVGCSCHPAHNPYMEHTNEFSNCYNCHGAGGVSDQETPFDTGKFMSGPAPLVQDDNTLLLLHLDKAGYEGENKEKPVEKTGLRSVTGRYGLGVSFETAYATTKLVYPLWTKRVDGTPGQPGVQHDVGLDLTIRFESTCNDEDAAGSIYGNSCSTAVGITYVEGYIPGVTRAAWLDVNDTLTYYSSASAYSTPPGPKANVNILEGSFEARIKIGSAGSGIQDTAQDRYIFLHTTSSGTPYKNAIFLRHSRLNTWDVGVSDETGAQSSIVSAEDELTAGWHHIAWTWSKAGKQLEIYIDGALAASEGAQFFPSSTAATFRIGSSPSGGTINTYIDDVQVSNYAKTDAEILEDYNCQNEINFNPRNGTLAFWVKPYWDGSDPGNHTFFEDYYNESNYFLLHKVDVAGYQGRLKGTIVGQGVQRDVYDFIDMPAGVWAHIAISWDSSRMNLYLNGERIDDSTYVATMMSDTDTAVYFGSRKDGTEPVRAVMDEIWIADVMVDSSVIAGIYNGNSNIITGPIPIEGYVYYEGGSRHPINYDIAGFEASGRTDVTKMECLKCHLQFDSTTYYHGGKAPGGVVKFVNVDSSMVWNKRVSKYDNGTKRGVTLFCLSCHMREDINFSTVIVGTSGWTFSASDTAYGGKPVQLRPLIAGETPKPKGGGKYYYPIDTASAHFDTSFGAGAFGDLSCTDCHDPHGSINKSMLQDFEEAKEDRDYNRDGVKTREIQYLDRENVRLYQLNEEKFCYFCHNGKFNTTGVNRGWQMKDIESKFAHSGAHHIVDDDEQAENDVLIECTSCHNPHTAKRDAVVLNPQTGARTYVTDAVQMNSFCIGCHGDSTISPVILTGWCEGVKFPGLDTNEVAPEWLGNSWNEFNKQSMVTTMVSGCKHYGNIACAACHDPHGTSNYRMLCEAVINKYPALGGNPASPSTTYVYGLKLMLQTKPDGRVRYEVYSTATETSYSINKFCFGCHTGPLGQDPYYPRGYVYPGETAYTEWDFGVVDSSSKYDSLTKYDSIISGSYKYIASDIYGKDKDCDYCHSPHGPDSVRVHMVRDNVPQDLDRNSPNYGDRIDSADWFQEGFPATGVDFCLSKGCHVTNRFAKLGPRDPNYVPGGDSKWWYKPYDQFNLLDYGMPNALAFSWMRPESFKPDNVRYTSDTASWASKHPIVPYGEFTNRGNTLICLSCHTPHGSPGNTELAKVYGSNYESTYPQDNAGLRRAYYRRIYWWPVTFWKRGYPNDIANGHTYDGPSWGALTSETRGNDVNGNSQSSAYYSPFTLAAMRYINLNDSLEPTPPGAYSGIENPLFYSLKVMDSTVPSAGNDLCYMCHRQTDVAGTTGWPNTYIGIDSTKTRFIGHEAVVDGSKIGETKFGVGSIYGNVGLNLNFAKVPNDFHKFTCSMCHGPHAATNEKLITNKCFAYNKQKPPSGKKDNDGRPSVYCHPYDNSDGTVAGVTNWNTSWGGNDAESGNKFYGWRNMFDTARTDFDRPVNSVDTLYIHFNTTGAYDTSVDVMSGPGIFYVTCSDLDVALSWRSVRDSTGATNWAHHYNVYRGETTLTQQNKAFKSKAIKTWERWGYSLVDRVLDTGYIGRADTSFSTLYTIDPSFAHTVGKKYFYMVVPADYVDNEAIVPRCQDTVGVSFAAAGGNTLAPRPVTAMSLAQESYETGGGGYGYRMRFTWQDPGDNLACSTYVLCYNTVTVGSFNTTQLQNYLAAGVSLGSMADTSFNTDIITAVNFGDYYGTTHGPISVDTGKVYVFGIKPVDNQNNTASAFSVKYVRMTDAVPALITDLKAIPYVTANLSNAANNNYNVVLSWSVPYDNAQPATSIPIYKAYRRLDKPIGQLDIDDYNLKASGPTDITCTTLTGYSSYARGDAVYWTDNVEPNKVYYYAVTSVDKYSTDSTVNRVDTAYGYRTDHVGWLYREQMMPSHNTKLLGPFAGQMKPAKTNTHFSFSFIGADYETAYFKRYNFYYRYNTDKAWRFGASVDTLNHGAPNPSICWASGCHPSQVSHGDTTQCISCHPGNARGHLDLDTSYATGNYYFAGSIVYNSVKVIVDGRTTWVNNLGSPLNEVATMNVVDLIPPSPLTLSAGLVPLQENGYGSVKLSWSGGGDTNFKNYQIKYRSEMAPTTDVQNTAWVVQDTLWSTANTTWTKACPAPDEYWQSTTVNRFGGFVYRYELRAWDSADNFSSASVRISTRPPYSGMGPGFNFTGTSVGGIKLTWQNMYQYSYDTNYAGATGYNIYAKETTGVMSRIFKPGTLEVDTAYGIVKIGTVPAVLDSAYSTVNQALSADVSASSGLFSPSSAKDGYLATFWKADFGDTSFSSTFIEFDLGTTKAIASIVYNNSFAQADIQPNTADSTQGYAILVSSDKAVWETVASQSSTAVRGETRYERNSKTPIRYIKVTNFSRYDLTELMAYYPTETTTFVHSYNNQYLRAVPGHSYAYSMYLEDSSGVKSSSAYSTTSYRAKDVEKPSPVVDLIAFGSSVDNKIRLKWSRPYDNTGVTRYEIWRRLDSADIKDGEFPLDNNTRVDSTVAGEWFVDTTVAAGESRPYWYAVCAVDFDTNRSDFAGTNYSAHAYVNKDRDTIPPEPITLVSLNYSKGPGRKVALTWTQGYDKTNYDTSGQEDTTFDSLLNPYCYSIYKVDYGLDPTPFANELAILNRDSFNNGYSTTSSTVSGTVASGWKVGTWGSPKVVASIDNSAQKLVIYNYVGNPREKLETNPKYVKNAAYIKSTGYEFETSTSVENGAEMSATHYIFGVWLKAEGQFNSTYIGNVHLDIAEGLNTGNETTYKLIARRTLVNPSNSWTYYVLNLVTPTSGLTAVNENGIMMWANNDGTIWLDSAKLVCLGKPQIRDNRTSADDNAIQVNSTYCYLVTSVDRGSVDGNPDDGFRYNGNEGDFANVLSIACDESGPVFDSVFTEEWDSTPGNPWDVKTGTTPTIQLVPAEEAYGSDNIFKNGDRITLRFKLKDRSTGQPDTTILEEPGDGALVGDFSGIDTNPDEASAANTWLDADGYYNISYPFSTTNTRPDTYYNTTTLRYENLYRIRIRAVDKMGNGPRGFDDDDDTTDNNPDTTYQCILNNWPPGPGL